GTQALGIQALAEGGRARDVAKEDGDDLALLACRRRLGERGTAGVAEARTLAALHAAARASRHERETRAWSPLRHEFRPTRKPPSPPCSRCLPVDIDLVGSSS